MKEETKVAQLRSLIKRMAKENPNDIDLGKKIRKLVNSK